MRLKLLACKTGHAYVICKDGTQHLQKNWLGGKFYEHRMLNYIVEHHRYPNMVYVDVGASVGNHTLFFAAFCTCRMVIAIEPVRKSMELLRANIALNELSHRVMTCEVAVSDEEGRGAMERFGGPRYDGMQKLVDGDSVDVLTLDKIIPKTDPLALIKIDVEYHEVKVLEGAMETLKTHMPILFIEIVDDENLEAVKDLLFPLKYRIANRFNASATYEFVPTWYRKVRK